MIKIVEVNDVKYQVIREISGVDEELVNLISKRYGEWYDDFVLLRSKQNPAVELHHLACRVIDDVDFVRLKRPKRKRQRKKRGW